MEVLSLLDHYSNTKIDSHFRVVIIGVQRAKLLLQGAHPASTKPFAKETSRALYEVLQGDVDFVVGKDARLARETHEENQRQERIPEPSQEAPTSTLLGINTNADTR